LTKSAETQQGTELNSYVDVMVKLIKNVIIDPPIIQNIKKDITKTLSFLDDHLEIVKKLSYVYMCYVS
jgi:hypothetical protein